MLKRFPRWFELSLLGVLQVVISLINALRGGAILVGDRAIFALLVKDAATGSFPSVGQYSWHGWNHPGALIFYVFAPFHWLSCGASWGLFVGVAFYSCALLVLIAWLGYRLRGTWGSALGVATLAACWVSVGRIASVDAWTPYLALPLFILFCFAALGVTERDRPSMWLLWVSGAVVVQVHIGYLPLVGLVGLVACIVFWWTGGNQRSITRPIATAVLLFSPYLFHLRQAVRNLGDLAQYFVTTDEPSIGWARALRVMSFEMSPQASWLAGPSEVGLVGEAPPSSLTWFVGVVLGLLAMTLWVWRSPENSPRHKYLYSAPLVWTMLVAGTVAVSQVRGLSLSVCRPMAFGHRDFRTGLDCWCRTGEYHQVQTTDDHSCGNGTFRSEYRWCNLASDRQPDGYLKCRQCTFCSETSRRFSSCSTGRWSHHVEAGRWGACWFVSRARLRL